MTLGCELSSFKMKFGKSLFFDVNMRSETMPSLVVGWGRVTATTGVPTTKNSKCDL